MKANEMFGPSPRVVMLARVWQLDYEAQQREEREFKAQQKKVKKNTLKG
jgi:hypothetical protein